MAYAKSVQPSLLQLLLAYFASQAADRRAVDVAAAVAASGNPAGA